MKKRMKCILPTSIVTKTAYIDNNPTICFPVKDVTKFKHNHDIIHQGRRCKDHYLEEAACKVSQRVLNHGGRDSNSHIFKHSVKSGHERLQNY